MQVYYETHHKDFRFSSHSGENKRRVACYAHLHQQIELVYMRHGSAVAILDSKRYALEDDCLFLALPNSIHSYESREKEDFQLVLVHPDRIPDFETLLGGRYPGEPILREVSKHPEIVTILELIEKEVHTEPDGQRDAVLQGCFLALFGLLFRLLPMDGEGLADTDMMRRIVDFCVANCDRELSLAILANELHISKYYISHLFGKRFPMRFNEYIHSLRLVRACRYLESTDMTVTEVGSLVGFGSMRTFNRAFRKRFSMSPGEYRATKGEEVATLDMRYGKPERSE